MKRYETFWRRVGARFIDGLVFSPLTFISLYLMVKGMSYPAYAGLCILQLGIGAAYWVGLHYWRGQTLGKMVTRVKVVRADGQPLELSDVFIRYFPGLLAGLMFIAPGLWLLREEPVVDFKLLTECQSAPAGLLNSLWGLAQFITVLSNDRRRAVHDFMAGTEVMRTD